MNLSSGYPFWLIKDGLINEYPYLDKDLKTGVLVMGGGISGALMLYQLVNAGIDCALIDKRSIGLGSTCASTSLLQYEIDVPLTELVQKIGKQNAFTAYKLCSDAIDKLEAIALKIGFNEFKRNQSLYYAAHKKDNSFLEKEFLLRKQAGFDIKLLDEKNVKQKFRFRSTAALLSSQGAQTNAYRFTHELLKYCISKGCKVYDRTESVSVKYSKTNVIVTTSNKKIIKAGKIIFATGYEVTEKLSKDIVKLKATYAVCSEQMDKKNLSRLSDTLIWNTADPYLYMRCTSDNRILIGGRDEDYYNPTKRDKLLPKKIKQLAADFKKLFPQIPFQPEFSWTGTFGSTTDGLPFIGNYKKQDQAFYSLGFGGNGITFSQIAADIITGMIKGKKNKQQDLFSFNRV